MTTISVIIPVFNVEEYLAECLDSILAQTLPDIEIICVDDGSEDSSLEILEKYSSAHPSIKVFRQKNLGAGIARNLALDNATGKYVAFMDADDRYPDSDALKFLWDLAEDNGCKVAGGYPHLFADDATEEESAKFTYGWLKRNRYPELGVIDFADYQSPLGYQRYIFSREMLDGAKIRFKDLRRFQDPPFCAEALHCAGKMAVSDRVVYDYRRGNHGIDWAGEGGLRARHFLEGRLFIVNFARTHGYAKLFNMMTEDLDRALPPAVYEIPEVKAASERLSEYIAAQNIKTIAFAFSDFSQGGIQRVMEYLVRRMVMNWYRVVLLTTNGPDKDVYHLDVPVVRVVLGAGEFPEMRSIRIRDAIEKYGIEVVLFQEYYSPFLVEDAAAVSDCGVPYIIHHHNMFSNFFLRHSRIDEIAHYRCFAQAAAMVVLSRSDEYYFRALGCNAHFFPNPVSDVPKTFVRAKEPHSLVWMARYTDVKRPMDAVKIFERVLEKFPDARLYMLGETSGLLAEEVQKYVSERAPLAEAVRFEGFQADVWSYLARAEALLTTAKFEGFPCTLAEACAAGVPTVGYEMPYLELALDNEGFIGTKQEDVAAAADVICRLFEDAAFASRASRAARATFERIRDFDQVAAYTALFDEVARGVRSASTPSDMQAMVLNTTVSHGTIALKELKERIARLDRDRASLRKQRDKANGTLNEVKAALAKRVTGTSIPDSVFKFIEDARNLLKLRAKLANREEVLGAYRADAAKLKGYCEALRAKIADREEVLGAYRADAAKRKSLIQNLMRENAELKAKLAQTGNELAQKNMACAKALAERDSIAKSRAQALAQRDYLAREVKSLAASESYRLGLVATWPLRKLSHLLRRKA